jgi:hypothetical protein
MHAFPHWAQLELSLLVSTHIPLQNVEPVGHPASMVPSGARSASGASSVTPPLSVTPASPFPAARSGAASWVARLPVNPSKDVSSEHAAVVVAHTRIDKSPTRFGVLRAEGKHVDRNTLTESQRTMRTPVPRGPTTSTSRARRAAGEVDPRGR